MTQSFTSDPIYALSAGGGWDFLASATAAASATLEFTADIDATYYMYAFVFENIAPASDLSAFQSRTRDVGGGGYDSAVGDYAYSISATSGDTSNGAGTNINITTATGNDTNEALGGTFYLINPSNTEFTRVVYHTGSNIGITSYRTCLGSGARRDAVDIDAIQFFFNTGNIASGTIKMYGCCKPA